MKTLNSFQQFDELFDRLMGSTHEPAQAGRILPIDVVETADRFLVRAAVPGVEPGEINVQVENNVLTIRAERAAPTDGEGAKVYRRENAYGTFSRSLRLSERLDTEAISADYRNGVVELSIPRVPEPGAKTITVNVASALPQAGAPTIQGEAVAAPSESQG